MSKQSRSLDLFEGILIGIYGNWIISLVDKVNLDQWYKPIAVIVSFICLILFFLVRVFKPELMLENRVLLLYLGHAFGIAWSLDYTVHNALFLGVGAILFIAIYKIDMERVILITKEKWDRKIRKSKKMLAEIKKKIAELEEENKRLEKEIAERKKRLSSKGG